MAVALWRLPAVGGPATFGHQMWAGGRCPSRGTTFTVARMNEGIPRSVVASPDVTIEAAAELSGVGVATMRGWAENGTLTIQARGDMEVVQLDRVRTLAARERTHGRSALRARLQSARGSAPDGQLDVGALQHLARERAGARR